MGSVEIRVPDPRPRYPRPSAVGWHHFSPADGMEPNVRVVYDPKDRPNDPPAMENFKQISRLLDSKFQIPGTGIRFGLDPIFSLMPFLGDLITLVISSMLIYTMQKHGASRKVVVKMMINAGLDTVIGAIPVVGTVFDVFYKANERNVRLLREHYYEGKHQGSGTGLLILIFVIALLIVAAVVYGLWKLIEWIF
ncbi:MAG TPA: DUF4112 domain-containing protein [Chryseosolibacter sp.]|nr:DUF4112 domain-containing protein [Chryseosolibacter sp.]